MVNGVKLDVISSNSSDLTRLDPPTNAPQMVVPDPSFLPKKPDIMVTSQMNQLVNLVKGDTTMPDDSARVQAVKSSIQSNQYQINLSALADKLTTTVLAKSTVE